MVQLISRQALNYAYLRLKTLHKVSDYDDFIIKMKTQNFEIHSWFRFLFALSIAHDLGKQFPFFERIWIYGSTTKKQANKSSDIDMIFQVSSDYKLQAKQILSTINQTIDKEYSTLFNDRFINKIDFSGPKMTTISEIEEELYYTANIINNSAYQALLIWDQTGIYHNQDKNNFFTALFPNWNTYYEEIYQFNILIQQSA